MSENYRIRKIHGRLQRAGGSGVKDNPVSYTHLDSYGPIPYSNLETNESITVKRCV